MGSFAVAAKLPSFLQCNSGVYSSVLTCAPPQPESTRGTGTVGHDGEGLSFILNPTHSLLHNLDVLALSDDLIREK